MSDATASDLTLRDVGRMMTVTVDTGATITDRLAELHLWQGYRLMGDVTTRPVVMVRFENVQPRFDMKRDGIFEQFFQIEADTPVAVHREVEGDR